MAREQAVKLNSVSIPKLKNILQLSASTNSFFENRRSIGRRRREE
jgi:hypothetical protein